MNLLSIYKLMSYLPIAEYRLAKKEIRGKEAVRRAETHISVMTGHYHDTMASLCLFLIAKLGPLNDAYKITKHVITVSNTSLRKIP